jgi:hypothetical protein
MYPRSDCAERERLLKILKQANVKQSEVIGPLFDTASTCNRAAYDALASTMHESLKTAKAYRSHAKEHGCG